jgi:hypothetical protein
MFRLEEGGAATLRLLLYLWEVALTSPPPNGMLCEQRRAPRVWSEPGRCSARASHALPEAQSKRVTSDDAL